MRKPDRPPSNRKNPVSDFNRDDSEDDEVDDIDEIDDEE